VIRRAAPDACRGRLRLGRHDVDLPFEFFITCDLVVETEEGVAQLCELDPAVLAPGRQAMFSSAAPTECCIRWSVDRGGTDTDRVEFPACP
jgi:hypothetical protein